MTPLLNPLPVLGLRSPCSFFNQDIYFLRDIWQCLGMFLVVATGECTNIQWVKDSDSAKWPTVHMTAPTKNVDECWRCESLPGPPSLSGKCCSQWASSLLQVSTHTQPGRVAYPDLLASQVTQYLILSIPLCIVIPIYEKAKHQRTRLPALDILVVSEDFPSSSDFMI